MYWAFYHHITRRHGKQKAIVTLAHKVLVILYHILRTKTPYADLGANYFEQRDRGRIERHHIHRLEQLGYTVTLRQRRLGNLLAILTQLMRTRAKRRRTY